jgi:hypothetical protein
VKVHSWPILNLCSFTPESTPRWTRQAAR